MATLAVTGRADLTDAQWAVLEPQLPRGNKPGRPPTWTKRQLIDGIRWRTRTGSPWRDVPSAYGPWQTVYGLFRRWQRNGTWRKILTALQGRADAAGLITLGRVGGLHRGAGAPARAVLLGARENLIDRLADSEAASRPSSFAWLPAPCHTSCAAQLQSQSRLAEPPCSTGPVDYLNSPL